MRICIHLHGLGSYGIPSQLAPRAAPSWLMPSGTSLQLLFCECSLWYFLAVNSLPLTSLAIHIFKCKLNTFNCLLQRLQYRVIDFYNDCCSCFFAICGTFSIVSASIPWSLPWGQLFLWSLGCTMVTNMGTHSLGTKMQK